MKRITALLLVIAMLLTMSPVSLADASNYNSNVDNYTEFSIGDTKIVTFDTTFDNELYTYHYTYTNDKVNFTVKGKDKTDKVEMDKKKDLVFINGEKYKLSSIFKESVVYEDLYAIAPNKIQYSINSYNSVVDPVSLSYNYLLTANIEYDLNAIGGGLMAVSIVAGLLVAFISPPAGYAVTKAGASISKTATVISVLAGGGSHFVGDEVIYFKKRQHQSSVKARIDPASSPMYVYRNSVRYYNDSTYNTSISSWEIAGYFQ